MSTLKTHNLQSPDAGSVNIVMTPNAGMVVTGISTFSNDVLITDKIIHTGDTNTAIRFPSADTFSVETAGSERLRIHSNGNVKIGSGSPAIAVGSGLEIDTGSAATIRLEDSSSTSSFEIQNTGSVIKQRMYNSQPWVIEHGSGEKFRINSNGNFTFSDNGGDNRIVKYTTSGGPYLLFDNRGINTTDNSGVYNMGGISASGYRDVANPSVVGSIQFERQPTASGASSGCDIVFRTGFNGTTSHTGIGEKLRLTYGGHLLPGANNQYDLGSVAKGWRNVYMNDLNLSNMNGDTNDVDGTQGSWTIQEGKDDLYIINRLNGKKFKIKMEEIS